MLTTTTTMTMATFSSESIRSQCLATYLIFVRLFHRTEQKKWIGIYWMRSIIRAFEHQSPPSITNSLCVRSFVRLLACSLVRLELCVCMRVFALVRLKAKFYWFQHKMLRFNIDNECFRKLSFASSKRTPNQMERGNILCLCQRRALLWTWIGARTFFFLRRFFSLVSFSLVSNKMNTHETRNYRRG